MNSKQFCSFDNLFAQVPGYYSLGLWLLLALKSIISIKGGFGMLQKVDVGRRLKIC